MIDLNMILAQIEIEATNAMRAKLVHKLELCTMGIELANEILNGLPNKRA